MKSLQRFLTGLAACLLLLSGVLLLGASAGGPARWATALDEVRGYPEYAMGIGAFFMLIALVLWFAARRSRPAADRVIFKGEGGKVSVSVDLVARQLASLKEEFPSVRELEPALMPVGRGVDIDLRVAVERGAPIPELTRALQERAREVVAERVGVTAVRHVRVEVREAGTETAASSEPPPVVDSPDAA